MKKQWKKLTSISTVLIILVVITLKIVGGKNVTDPQKKGVINVRVETPKRTAINTVLQFNGDILPIQQANIFTKVNGTLERVYINIGDRVHANQLLALIDTVELAQQVDQTGATFQNAKANYARSKELAEQNLVSKQDLDNADAAMKVAKANFEFAKTRRSYAAITAPFSGYITKRFFDAGTVISSANTTLFSLVDLDVVKVMVNILEKDLPLIKKGGQASISVDAYPDKIFTGTITRFSEALDLSTRTMAIEIDIRNPEHLLKGGMFATVTLLLAQHQNALTVPVQALLKDVNGLFVFAVEKNIAMRIPVTIGSEQDSRTEILSGLTDAHSIITTGQQFVKDGGAVAIQK